MSNELKDKRSNEKDMEWLKYTIVEIMDLASESKKSIAFYYAVIALKNYCYIYDRKVMDIIKELDNYILERIHREYTICSIENSDVHNKYDDEIKEFINYLLNEYGNIIDFDTNTKNKIYTRKAKNESVEKVAWQELLGDIRSNRDRYGGGKVYYGNLNEVAYIKNVKQLEEEIKSGRLIYFDYIDKPEDEICAFIKLEENNGYSTKENMIMLVIDNKSTLDKYGITAEIYTDDDDDDEQFIKLYRE